MKTIELFSSYQNIVSHLTETEREARLSDNNYPVFDVMAYTIKGLFDQAEGKDEEKRVIRAVSYYLANLRYGK